MKKFSRTLAVFLAAVAMVLPGTVQAAPVVEEPIVPVERLAGLGRVETAVEVSEVGYKDGAEAVVLAGFFGEVDALTGTLLANAVDAPLLLTHKADLSEVTKDEILRLGAKTVYILGGEKVVSKQVVTDLEALENVKVERIFGDDRYETAEAVAKKAAGKTTHVFLALGDNDYLADALSVGPVSAIEDMPVLLTTKNYIPQATKDAMGELGVTDVTIVGGEEAISKDIYTELGKKYTVDRVDGADRYGTAEEIAKRYFTNSKKAIITNDGQKSYADALVGGYLGALKGAPILLTRTDSLNAITESYLTSNTDKAYVLGGVKVIEKPVFNQMEKAIKDEIEVKETIKLTRNYKSIKVTGDNVEVDLNDKTVGKLVVTSNDAVIKNGLIKNIVVGKDVTEVTLDDIIDDGDGNHEFEGGGSESIILKGKTQLKSRINISSATPIQIRAEKLDEGKGMTGTVSVNTEAPVMIAAPVEELEVKKANKDIQIKAVVTRVSALADVKITVAENIKTPKLEKAKGVKATATDSKGKEEVFEENEKLEPTVPVEPEPAPTPRPPVTPSTPALTVTKVSAVNGITVEFGTAKENLELPETITLNLSDGKTDEVDVEWSNKEYNGNVAKEYIFVGSYELPEGVTGEKPEATAKVRVESVDTEAAKDAFLTDLVNSVKNTDVVKSVERDENSTDIKTTFIKNVKKTDVLDTAGTLIKEFQEKTKGNKITIKENVVSLEDETKAAVQIAAYLFDVDVDKDSQSKDNDYGVKIKDLNSAIDRFLGEEGEGKSGKYEVTIEKSGKEIQITGDLIFDVVRSTAQAQDAFLTDLVNSVKNTDVVKSVERDENSTDIKTTFIKNVKKTDVLDTAGTLIKEFQEKTKGNKITIKENVVSLEDETKAAVQIAAYLFDVDVDKDSQSKDNDYGVKIKDLNSAIDRFLGEEGEGKSGKYEVTIEKSGKEIQITGDLIFDVVRENAEK